MCFLPKHDLFHYSFTIKKARNRLNVGQILFTIQLLSKRPGRGAWDFINGGGLLIRGGAYYIYESTRVWGMGSGFLRKSTGANGRNQFSTNTYRKLVLFLQKSPKVSGNLREFAGECNLGILYFSSLLAEPRCARASLSLPDRTPAREKNYHVVVTALRTVLSTFQEPRCLCFSFFYPALPTSSPDKVVSCAHLNNNMATCRKWAKRLYLWGGRHTS